MVRSWRKQYLAEGWDAVAYDGCIGGHSKITPAQEVGLGELLEERFCRSTVQIRAYMSAKLGIRILIPAAASFWPDWGRVL